MAGTPGIGGVLTWGVPVAVTLVYGAHDETCVHTMAFVGFLLGRGRTKVQDGIRRSYRCGLNLEPGMPQSRVVKFRCGAETVNGFLASRSRRGRHRAIIAIHEWWSVTPWVKAQASTLAKNGYVVDVVLALDLYHGKKTLIRSEARKRKQALPLNRTIDEMKAAFDYLACRAHVDPQHIGSLGWSMGGALALQLAIHEPRLVARGLCRELWRTAEKSPRTSKRSTLAPSDSLVSWIEGFPRTKCALFKSA